MRFTKENLNLENGLKKEWLVTNGIGGYSYSTILGCNTRKYHGLLVVPLSPPAKRFVVLCKVDESIIVKDKQYDLYTNVCENFISEDVTYEDIMEEPENYYLCHFIGSYNTNNIQIIDNTVAARIYPYIKWSSEDKYDYVQAKFSYNSSETTCTAVVDENDFNRDDRPFLCINSNFIEVAPSQYQAPSGNTLSAYISSGSHSSNLLSSLTKLYFISTNSLLLSNNFFLSSPLTTLYFSSYFVIRSKCPTISGLRSLM